MANGPKIKTGKLSIYLIKSEFQRTEDIVDSQEVPVEIDGVGKFVFDESRPYRPDWVEDFFGSTLSDELRIISSSAKGVLIVPVKSGNETHHFALCFGVGRHLLKDGVVEERFGLKVVLNSMDLESFRSIDKTTLGSVPKHSREQMSRDVAPSDFGIDVEQDLVSSVTGKSRDAKLGKTITGKDALTVSVKVDITNIQEFLSHCLERYKSEDYKKNFDWIDQIADVRDRRLEAELNNALIEKLTKNELDKVWMAVPEVINWADLKGFRYLRAKLKADLHDDLDLKEFLKALDGREIDMDLLRNAQVFMISAVTDEVIEHWPAYRCTYAEISLRGKLYVLNNSKWYEIAKGFTEQVQKDFQDMVISTVALPDCSVNDEGSYNVAAANALGDAFCMDRKLIPHGGGHSRIEFCDLYTSGRRMIHVKRYGGSSVLSHLFSQGVVSGELFVSDAEFRDKVNAELPATHKFADPRMRPNAAEYEVVYAIISESNSPLDIPFFSKVSLRNARRRLTSYGFPVSIKKIQKSQPAVDSGVAEPEAVLVA